MEILFDLYEHNDKCRFVLGNSTQNALICIGLNPSTATNIKDDNTIRKIQNMTKHTNKYDGLIMLNLSPEIATEPSNMSK